MNSNTIKKLTLVLLVSAMVHLMFSINESQQTGLNNEQNADSVNEAKDLDIQVSACFMIFSNIKVV
jgi:hypothetical protein